MGIILLSKFIIYFSGMLVFLVIIMQFDHTHWNGIEEENDKTILDRILNRFFLLTCTFSTSAYGIITPKTKITKCILIIVNFFIIINLFDMFHIALTEK